MDEITRPPRKEDLVKLCEELNRLGAKYIVIGGLAMNNLGLVRTTEDVDLLIDPSPENQHRVREALMILPEKAIRELGADEDLQQWIVTRVNDEIIVDLMTEACSSSTIKTTLAKDRTTRCQIWWHATVHRSPFSRSPFHRSTSHLLQGAGEAKRDVSLTTVLIDN
jgi:hypothetical protein